MRTAYFDRFTLRMTLRDALDVSTPGQDATEACKDLVRNNPYIDAQLAAIDDQTLVDELREYGAWTLEELADRDANDLRIVWIAGGNIAEECAQRWDVRRLERSR